MEAEGSNAAVEKTLNSDDSHIPREDFGKLLHGCEHYRRRCKLRAPCCDQVFTCRHCHDEATSTLSHPDERHELVRHDIKLVVCAVCDTEQQVSNLCTNCGVKFGEYFCDICKFYDDDITKEQFHCNECGICRFGGRDKYFHCPKCGSCYSIGLRDNHLCVEDSVKSHCPICYEFLSDSTKQTTIMKCGHTMHVECYEEMLSQNQYRCPVCSKSVLNMSRTWERLDQEIEATAMPEEYRYEEMENVGSSSPVAPPERSQFIEQSNSGQNSRLRSDIAWKHCYEVPSSGKTRTLKCLYCNQAISGGGINRMKQHLAGITGNVKACSKVPTDVRFLIKGTLIKIARNKKEKSASKLYDVACNLEGNDVESSKRNSSGSKKRKMTVNIESYMKAGVGIDSSQPSTQAELQRKERWHDTDMSIALWFYDCCIPMNVVNSPYFQPMISRIATMGHGYTGPSYHTLRIPLLKEAKTQCQLTIDALRSKWIETGCTVMVDGWIDQSHRSLINFLVYCPYGISFIKSVAASDIESDAETLCNLFSEIVEMVGVNNVVHIVTQNASNYRKAGKLLGKKYPSIYWSPCSAHCSNLILKDISELTLVKNLITLASRITTVVYNHKWPHAWLRKRLGWTEIICPGDTRFGTTFIALKNLYDHKEHLEAMVVCAGFKKFMKNEKAKEVKQIVLDSTFWNNCLIIVKITGPIMRLLRMCDSDEKPSLGYVYEGMWRAIKGIKELFGNKEHLYNTYVDIINDRWDNMLYKRLHAAAFYLNPAFQYDPESLSQGAEALNGLLDVIEKLCPGVDNVLDEISMFRERTNSFGRTLAIKNAKTTRPDEWWRIFGSDAPNLQKIAIKLLSQTSSSSGCEHNWSVFERIHTKKRNRLEHQRLNDLVFVHYNLRLQQRGKQRKRSYDPLDYECIDKVDFWVIEEEPSGELDGDELEEMFEDELSNEDLHPSKGDEDEMDLINDPIDLSKYGCASLDSNGEINRILRKQRKHFISEDD